MEVLSFAKKEVVIPDNQMYFLRSNESYRLKPHRLLKKHYGKAIRTFISCCAKKEVIFNLTGL